MPPRLATVRYEDRAGHLTLSWATCCFSVFWRYSQLDWVCTWMLFLDGIWSWLHTLIALCYCVSCELCKTLHRQRSSGLIESQPMANSFRGLKSPSFTNIDAAVDLRVGIVWDLDHFATTSRHRFWIVDACNQLHHLTSFSTISSTSHDVEAWLCQIPPRFETDLELPWGPAPGSSMMENRNWNWQKANSLKYSRVII